MVHAAATARELRGEATAREHCLFGVLLDVIVARALGRDPKNRHIFQICVRNALALLFPRQQHVLPARVRARQHTYSAVYVMHCAMHCDALES